MVKPSVPFFFPVAMHSFLQSQLGALRLINQLECRLGFQPVPCVFHQSSTVARFMSLKVPSFASRRFKLVNALSTAHGPLPITTISTAAHLAWLNRGIDSIRLKPGKSRS